MGVLAQLHEAVSPVPKEMQAYSKEWGIALDFQANCILLVNIKPKEIVVPFVDYIRSRREGFICEAS